MARKIVHFVQADVFTETQFGGNQLAVFTNGTGLSTDDMQNLAREMNYSESTFVLPPEMPGAVKRVRIFTPGKEMPMAGHPTVGTAFVLAQRSEIPSNGDSTEAKLQLGIGLVSVEIEQAQRGGKPDFVWMNHRPAEFGPTIEKGDEAAAALGLAATDLATNWPMQVVSTGLPFLFVPLVSVEAAGRCYPNSSTLLDLCTRLGVAGLYAFSASGVLSQTQFHARMFASPELGLTEDPATGSAAAPFGAYVARYGLLPRTEKMRFAVEQGVEMRRPSRIEVKVQMKGEQIAGLAIGGRTVIVGEGDIFWD